MDHPPPRPSCNLDWQLNEGQDPAHLIPGIQSLSHSGLFLLLLVQKVDPGDH